MNIIINRQGLLNVMKSLHIHLVIKRKNMGKEIIPRVRRYKINTDEDWKVEIKIGDKVLDMFGDSGSFHVEEIRKSDGWVWGSDMKQPYYDGDKKNFHDYHMTWLV